MEVSVIIPTYNRAASLANTLDALKIQTIQDFELIVVIDGSADHTGEMLELRRDEFDSFSILKQVNQGRAIARNSGAAVATGDIFVFYDDDTRPSKNSVQLHSEFHSRYPGALCGGAVIEDEHTIQTDFQEFRRYLTRKWTKKFSPGLNHLNSENLFLSAANFSIPKPLFKRLNGFDSRLNDVEDFDLAARALQGNIPVYFDKTNTVYHDDPVNCKNFILRQRQYNAARKELYQLKPDTIPNHRSRSPFSISPVKRKIFDLVSHKSLAEWIDKENLTWIPEKLRFSLYDWVVTGLGTVFPDRKI